MITKQCPKVIFHIGQHKTGSKALQSYLSINRQNLLKHNIFYPHGNNSNKLEDVYHRCHFLLYVLAKYELLKNFSSNESKDFWKSHKKFCERDSVLSFFELVENNRKKYKAHTIIFSAEDLFDMQTAHELSFNQSYILRASHLLVEAAKKIGWDPNLVVYLRRPDALLNAHYAQFIKGSDLNHLSFEDFYIKFKPRLDALNILKSWENSFTKEKMFIRPYENASMHAGIVSDFFKNFMNFMPDANWLTPRENIEFSNETPSQFYIDLIRESNLARSKGLRSIARASILETAFKDKDKKSSLNWMGAKETQNLLDEYKTDFKLIATNYCNKKSEFFNQGWTTN